MRVFPLRRLLLLATSLAACLATVRAEAQNALKLAQPDVGRFPEVRLFAYPTDAAGHVIENLSAGQFRVTEDGRAATVLDVHGGASGSIALCLVLDRSGSMEQFAGQGSARKIDAAYDAARQFVRSLRDVDRAGVISFSDQASLDRPLTGSKEQLLAALQTPTPDGQTALYDAVHDAIRQVALRPQGGNILMVDVGLVNARRTVLVLTDGEDSGSGSIKSAGPVVQEARANSVSLYTIGFGRDVNEAMLQYLAQETGGEYYAAPNSDQLAQIYQRMARRLQDEYRVTFRTPSPEADGTRREVVLNVLNTPLPAAHTWYQAPGRGSLVVAIGPSNGAPVTGAEGPEGPARGVGVGVLLLGIGLAGLATAALLLFTVSHRPARAGNAGMPPPVDFGLLWAHGPVTTIGRDDSNHVVVESPRVSRQHARIEQQGGAYRLVNLGSSNGTWLNRARVHQVLLRPGDEVQFGNARFRFTAEPPHQADASPD